VRRGFLIVVPKPMSAAPLVVFFRYLIVVATGEEQLC